MRTLTLPLKAEYFDAIRDGTKPEEFRLVNDYWSKRLVGREYDRIILTKGYPRADDTSRRLERPWRGFTVKTITHPHFGNVPMTVYAITVGEPTTTADDGFAQAILRPLAFRLAARAEVGENVAIGQGLRKELERAVNGAADRLETLREALVVARSVMSPQLSPSACAFVDAALLPASSRPTPSKGEPS